MAFTLPCATALACDTQCITCLSTAASVYDNYTAWNLTGYSPSDNFQVDRLIRSPGSRLVVLQAVRQKA
jgi:hypothetical protein